MYLHVLLLLLFFWLLPSSGRDRIPGPCRQPRDCQACHLLQWQLWGWTGPWHLLVPLPRAFNISRSGHFTHTYTYSKISFFPGTLYKAQIGLSTSSLCPNCTLCTPQGSTLDQEQIICWEVSTRSFTKARWWRKADFWDSLGLNTLC